LQFIADFWSSQSPTGFSGDPLNAVFETKDTDRFWKAFDKMETSKENPFQII
jgi:hypothetical protein